MNNGKFDTWFDDAFEKTVSSSSLSSDQSKKESWQNVQAKIEQLNKWKKRKRHFQLAAVVAASVSAGAIVFNPPAVTQAISPVVQSIKDIGNGMVTIITEAYNRPNEDGALTAAPDAIFPEDPNKPSAELNATANHKTFMYTLEEVKSKVSFPYPDLKNIPERFELFSTEMADIAPGKKTDSITLTYKTSTDEKMRITLDSSNIQQSTTTTGSEDTQVLTLNNHIEVFYTAGRYHAAQFIYNGLSIRIYGNLTKEELLGMIENLPE
ncbi:DUF4367 domain-containing protein [Paenibacillus sp. CMAA1364]